MTHLVVGLYTSHGCGIYQYLRLRDLGFHGTHSAEMLRVVSLYYAFYTAMNRASESESKPELESVGVDRLV